MNIQTTKLFLNYQVVKIPHNSSFVSILKIWLLSVLLDTFLWAKNHSVVVKQQFNEFNEFAKYSARLLGMWNISQKTATQYIINILNKLGLSNNKLKNLSYQGSDKAQKWSIFQRIILDGP